MSIKTSSELVENGCMSFPFPRELSRAMKEHICRFMGISPASQDSETLKRLTEKSLSYADQEFVDRFAKPFRMFPDSVALMALKWVSGLASLLEGKLAGINYVSKDEREKNKSLRRDSYDVFWRCVRPGKPDVGAPHCDYQFWELVRGTPHDVEVPFEYNERWKIWVPLMGCDPTNSLQVVKGSHAEEVPIDKVLTKNGYKPVIQPHWLNKHASSFVCPLTNFEDQCVLFHDKLVHQGPPNNTKNLRLSGELTILLRTI